VDRAVFSRRDGVKTVDARQACEDDIGLVGDLDR
jgi:hypothetical protein